MIPLQPRALPYRDYTMVLTFAPVRPEVLARVESALAAVASLPEAVALRTISRRRDPRAFAAAAVDRVDAALMTQDVMDRVQHAVDPRRGLTVLVSRERVTFALSHAMFDGLALAELARAVMTAAIGEQPHLDDRPPVRLPLLVGLRSVGPDAVLGYLRQRKAVAVPAPAVAAGVLQGSGRSIEVPVDRDVAQRIEQLPHEGRATPGARVASVAVAALQRVQRRDIDVPVAVPVSLRHHVGNRRVLGNFVGIQPMGSLRTSDWSPAAITGRLNEAVGSGHAMVDLAWVVLRSMIRTLRPARIPAAPGRVAISLQMMRLPAIMPAAAWAGGEPSTFAATVGPWPSATVLSPLRIGNRWFVTAWDESGEFDLAAFPQALLAELEAREASAFVA